jgi:hypothetical protein
MQESIQPSIPSRDEIAARAYEIWERNGRPAGQDVRFWLEAEQSLQPSLNPQPPRAAQIPPSVPPPQAKPAAAKLPGPRSKRSASRPAKGGF